MINVDKIGAYYFPLDKKPRGNELTLELYSELSLSSIVFEHIGGEVVGDYFLTTIDSGMTEQISNGEYNYTLYDNVDGEKVGIGLIRFDLEESGDTEYEVYEDFFDGFVQAIELEATGFTENGTYKVGEHQNGWNEVEVNVPLESTGFTENGRYVKADGGWNEVEVNIDTDFYIQSGYTSGYTDGYSSGYTDGYVDGQGETLNYFYFRSREDGSKVRFRVAPNPLWSVSLEYSTDRINWVEWDFSAITIDSGDTVYFRGNNPDGFNDKPAQGARWYFETPSGRFNIGGDIRSLIDKTINVTTPPTWGFGYLFRNTNIVEADKKLLSGFSLLNGGCFFHLFEKCKYITQAPDLPWLILEGECFNRMFSECTSLTIAPEISATNLSGYKPFWYMFQGCSNLNYIKCLITNPSQTHMEKWVDGVAATGTFVKDASADWNTGINGIPSGWTVKSEVELISTAITSNGTYTAETGQAFTAVTVDVPISSYMFPTEANSALTPYHLTQYVKIDENTNIASVYNGFENISTGNTYNICAFYVNVRSGDTISFMQVGNYENDDFANIDTFYWMDGGTSVIFTGVYLTHTFTKNYTGWIGVHRMQGNGNGYLSNLGNIGDYATVMAINDNYDVDNPNAVILTGKTYKFGKMEMNINSFVG